MESSCLREETKKPTDLKKRDNANHHLSTDDETIDVTDTDQMDDYDDEDEDINIIT